MKGTKAPSAACWAFVRVDRRRRRTELIVGRVVYILMWSCGVVGISRERLVLIDLLPFYRFLVATGRPKEGLFHTRRVV